MNVKVKCKKIDLFVYCKGFYRPLSEASEGYVFTLCVCPQGGVLSHNALGVLETPPPPGPTPPPPKKGTKKGQKKGQKRDKKRDQKRDKKNGQNFGQKIGQTLWKLLEVGGAGGTPLSVTQEDCLVCYADGTPSYAFLFSNDNTNALYLQ